MSKHSSVTKILSHRSIRFEGRLPSHVVDGIGRCDTGRSLTKRNLCSVVGVEANYAICWRVAHSRGWTTDEGEKRKEKEQKTYVEGSMEVVCMIDETTFLSGGDSGCAFSSIFFRRTPR
jgi:hypothetical protein